MLLGKTQLSQRVSPLRGINGYRRHANVDNSKRGEKRFSVEVETAEKINQKSKQTQRVRSERIVIFSYVLHLPFILGTLSFLILILLAT